MANMKLMRYYIVILENSISIESIYDVKSCIQEYKVICRQQNYFIYHIVQL